MPIEENYPEEVSNFFFLEIQNFVCETCHGWVSKFIEIQYLVSEICHG